MATAATAKPPLNMDVRIRLSIMMFLQFAVWGAWFVVFFGYLLKLGFSGGETGWIFGNMALGAILAPLVVGMIADRFMASERLMALLHLAGAGLLFLMAQLGFESGFFLYFTVSLLYALVYNPTLALANSISFSHIPDATRDFPGIRVWGTIGWILVNLIGGVTLNLDSNQPLLLAALLSAVLGVYSLALPHTPPTGKAGDPLPFLQAFGLFKDYSFAVFFVVSGLLTVVLAFYYSNTATFLQQCDSRMVYSPVAGYFQGTDTIKLTESDPKESDKEIKRPHKSATTVNIKAIVLSLTKKNDDPKAEEDKKNIDVIPSERILFNPPIEGEVLLETDEKGVGIEIELKAIQKTKMEVQRKKKVEKDGKQVEEWTKASEADLEANDTITWARAPGETLTLTLERNAINPATTMLWGQIAEMFLLPLLPFFLIRFGMKWVLVFGMLCWGLRYLLFAVAFPDGPFWAIFVGVLLHGICFDFFFAAAFIHVDNTAPKEIRASAQALFSLLTYGVGMWLGSVLSGYLNAAYTVNTLVPQVDWFKFWLVPAYGVIAAVVVFVLLFRGSDAKAKKAA